jgi:hypothetical protein
MMNSVQANVKIEKRSHNKNSLLHLHMEFGKTTPPYELGNWILVYPMPCDISSFFNGKMIGIN